MSNDSEDQAGHADEDDGQVSRPHTHTPAKAQTYAMSSMRTSRDGLAFIVWVEGRGGETDGLQWPGGKSGVTIGVGYDLHFHSPSAIINDLTSIGISREKAEILSRAAKLQYRAAADFVKNNKNLLSLTDSQKQALLQRVIGKYEQDLKNSANFPVTQYQFDALVSLAYNRGGRLSVITHSLAVGDFAQAEKDWLSRTHSGRQKMGGLVDRRKREVNLYKNGVYK